MKRPESLSPARRSSARRRTCRVWSGAGRTVPVPFDDATLRIAVREWLHDPTAAEVQYGHISDWDTSRVRDMSNLFSGAVDFNQPLRWNTRNVDNMESMFVQASSFNQPLELDTSRVRNMCNLFARAVNFDQPLVRWDTGNVRDMSFMFQGADAFNRPLQLDTHRVVDMESMFDGAIAFNQPLQWETSEVVNMAGMFSDARSFNQPLQWDTRNVRTMTWMFSDAVALNQSLQLDTQNVEDMACVFRGATTFDQPLQWNTCNVRSMTGMFIGAKAFNQPLPWDTRNVEDMSEMFAGAIAFDQPLSHWITSNVQTTAGMFIGASRFNQPLSNWDTRNVTTMAGMFIGASRFNQSLSSWDTRNVTTMRTIFDKAPLMLGRYPDGKIRRPIDRWTQVRDHYTPERRRPRWHWQESCDVGSDVPLDVLRGWAGEFGIPLHHPTTQRPKTKRAFCADLARWWDAQRDAQRTQPMDRRCGRRHSIRILLPLSVRRSRLLRRHQVATQAREQLPLAQKPVQCNAVQPRTRRGHQCVVRPATTASGAPGRFRRQGRPSERPVAVPCSRLAETRRPDEPLVPSSRTRATTRCVGGRLGWLLGRTGGGTSVVAPRTCTRQRPTGPRPAKVLFGRVARAQNRPRPTANPDATGPTLANRLLGDRGLQSHLRVGSRHSRVAVTHVSQSLTWSRNARKGRRWLARNGHATVDNNKSNDLGRKRPEKVMKIWSPNEDCGRLDKIGNADFIFCNSFQNLRLGGIKSEQKIGRFSREALFKV